MQTQEELLLELTLSALKHWGDTKKPANLLVTENNSLLITSAIIQNIKQTGRKPNVDEVDAIVKGLGDIDSGGKLQYHHTAGQSSQIAPAVPVDPRTAIPHQDIFPGIDTVRKCIEYITAVKIPYKDQPKINELLAYLKQHNIRDTGRPTTTPIPTDAKLIRDPNAKDLGAVRGRTKNVDKSDEVDWDGRKQMSDLGKDSAIRGRNKQLSADDRSEPFGQAVALLESLTKADVGSVQYGGAGGGSDAGEKLRNFLARVTKEVMVRHGRGYSDDKILEYTEGEVAKLRASSIR